MSSTLSDPRFCEPLAPGFVRTAGWVATSELMSRFEVGVWAISSRVYVRSPICSPYTRTASSRDAENWVVLST
ncbi:hypothetical protein D3C87_1345020 [compost metagenome]